MATDRGPWLRRVKLTHPQARNMCLEKAALVGGQQGSEVGSRGWGSLLEVF